MILTNNKINSFFKDSNQMGIIREIRLQLVEKSIKLLSDLVDFDKDTIICIAKNLRRPWKRMTNLIYSTKAGSTIPMLPFRFRAKSQICLITTIEILKFYEIVG